MTAVLAEAFSPGGHNAVAAAFYGGTLMAIGLLVSGMWWYPARPGSC